MCRGAMAPQTTLQRRNTTHSGLPHAVQAAFLMTNGQGSVEKSIITSGGQSIPKISVPSHKKPWKRFALAPISHQGFGIWPTWHAFNLAREVSKCLPLASGPAMYENPKNRRRDAGATTNPRFLLTRQLAFRGLEAGRDMLTGTKSSSRKNTNDRTS
jgi:hypothetical protein